MDIDDFITNVISRSDQHKCFYHFTATGNIPLIRDEGILATNTLRTKSLFDKVITGGNEWSLDADTRVGMDQYVHLCFMSEHPMEYLAREENRLESTKFLRIKPEVLKLPGVKITLEVSNKRGCVPLEPSVGLGQADLEVIYKWTDWRLKEVKNRLKVAKLYEILVPNSIPVELIRNLGNG